MERIGNLYVDLDKRVTQNEVKHIKRALVVNRLKTDDKISKCQASVENFLTSISPGEFEITEYFKLGLGRNNPVVIILSTMTQKINILQAMDMHKKKLARNNEAQQIFVADYMLPEVREQKRQEREIYRDNVNSNNPVDMEYQKGKLVVNKKQFAKRVNEPVSTDILSMSDQEVDNICQMNIPSGRAFESNGSVFKAFILSTNSHLEIDQAYMKLRLMYICMRSTFQCVTLVWGCQDTTMKGTVMIKNMEQEGSCSESCRKMICNA